MVFSNNYPLKMIFRFFKILLFAVCISQTTVGQVNPEQWFDTQYTQAIGFCQENSKLINSELSQCCVPQQMALAVAFPEMLRYSLWRDLFETAALEILYVNYGKQAADFSIGWMQMKPSFAELVEQKIAADSLLQIKYPALNKLNSINNDESQIRQERVHRLKDFKWQLKYLSAFVDINCKKLQANSIQYPEFLNYLAAAYNRGFNQNLETLANFSKTKTFPYGPGGKNPFGYCELASYFYRTQNIIHQNIVLKAN